MSSLQRFVSFYTIDVICCRLYEIWCEINLYRYTQKSYDWQNHQGYLPGVYRKTGLKSLEMYIYTSTYVLMLYFLRKKVLCLYSYRICQQKWLPPVSGYAICLALHWRNLKIFVSRTIGPISCNQTRHNAFLVEGGLRFYDWKTINFKSQKGDYIFFLYFLKALRKCVYWVKLFLRWAIYPVGLLCNISQNRSWKKCWLVIVYFLYSTGNHTQSAGHRVWDQNGGGRVPW